jgi:hypothetical protein
MNTEATALANIVDMTRDLVTFYTKNINEADWHTDFEFEGKIFNSIAWQIAHLAWAQNHLVLVASGGTSITKPWYDKVKIGSPKISSRELPSVEEIKSTFHDVHDKSIEHLKTLSTVQLDETNKLNLKFRNGDSTRISIYHHIRHEGTHVGQLSWLAKMHGSKTI